MTSTGTQSSSSPPTHLHTNTTTTSSSSASTTLFQNESAVIRKAGRQAIQSFLQSHPCFAVLRNSGKVVVFDIRIPIQLAFYALVEHGTSHGFGSRYYGFFLSRRTWVFLLPFFVSGFLFLT
jgi:hypothetical protein